MKLVTFLRGSAEVLGVLDAQGRVVDVQHVHRAVYGKDAADLRDALAFLHGGAGARERVAKLLAECERVPEALHAPSSVRLLAPVPRPASIRDCMAFERHLIQATRTVIKWKFPPLAWLDALVDAAVGRPLVGVPRVWHRRPCYYKGNVFSVVGPDSDIVWPAYSQKLDYELEFGLFIGKPGRDIPPERALEHVGGYTIFNDFSARDTQLDEMGGRLGPAKGKDFDTGNAMGPYLVTPDEVPDPHALGMVARVNGEEWSKGHSSEMGHSIPDIISYISSHETLHPGEFIGLGTCAGGCGLELDRWLEAGDVVELEVERLGVLRNRVVRGNSPTEKG